MKRISQQIAEWLVTKKVNKVFTVTGGGSMFLNFDLGSHPDMNCTFMHHEQACSMAAEAYARMSGQPAVVMVTTGPGSINAFNGVYGAYTDSIPMIILSGQVKSETCIDFHHNLEIRQLGDQEGPTIHMAQHITKYAKLIKSAAELETELPKAYALAISGRPGPVWLDIPIDIQNSTYQLNFNSDLIKTETNSNVQDELGKLCYQLRYANRPLILAGTGVRLAGAEKALVGFAEKYGIPIATAWTHDIIPSDHSLYAGRPGTIGTRAGNFCLQQADFVLVIGSRLNIRQTGYNWNSFAKNAWLVQVDIDEQELNKPTIQPDQKIICDASEFITLLDKTIEQTDVLPSFDNWVSWVQQIGEKYSVVKEHKHKNSKLNPYLIVERVTKQLRDNDIIVCGNASACILPFQVAKLSGNQRMFSNSGSASMGYDLPAAIGAATANKGRVICFAGDGSIQMNIQELQTIRALNANIIILILNNRGYLSIKQTHENFFGKIVGANPDSGITFPNFDEVAKSFGIHSVSIRSEADLWILDQKLRADGPILVNIHVDPDQNFAPRMRARLDENGKFIPLQLDDMYPFLDPEELAAVRNSAQAVKNNAKSRNFSS